jgi:hypothetical protein
MVAQQEPATKTKLLAAIGILAMVAGVVMMVNLLVDTPVYGSPSQHRLPAVAMQSAIVNGRSVYAIPITTGPEATAILQNVAAKDIAYVVHAFTGWGKAVSTQNGWFRCADIASIDQYNGSQVEVESWVLLTEQERTEAQTTCGLR